MSIRHRENQQFSIDLYSHHNLNFEHPKFLIIKSATLIPIIVHLPLVFSLEISLIFNNDGKLCISFGIGDEVVFIVFGVVGLKVVTAS